MNKVRVLIVEDQAMPRQLFEMYIRSSDQYELAGSIDRADMSDIYCAGGNVDLILMDVVTKDGASGLEAARRIKENYPRIRIIIVTSMPEYSYLKQAKEIGVDSFWYKEVSKEPILEIMDRTMAGESVYPESSPEIILGLALSTEFSQRELEVLKELMRGDTNAEIGAHLHISPETVKKHIQHMLDMTGFHSRTELAVRARETGLVIPEERDQ